MDPIMSAIAAAVAGKATEAIADGGRKALEALRDLVRRKFSQESSAQAALEAARPDDERTLRRLALELDMAAEDDTDFGAELKSAWQRARPFVEVNRSRPNIISGTVHGDVNQISTDGDVTIHQRRY